MGSQVNFDQGSQPLNFPSIQIHLFNLNEMCVSAVCIGFHFVPFSCKKRQKTEFFIMAQKLVVF